MTIKLKEVSIYDCCDRHVKVVDKANRIYECEICGREWFEVSYMDAAGSYRMEPGKTYKEKYLELLDRMEGRNQVIKKQARIVKLSIKEEAPSTEFYIRWEVRGLNNIAFGPLFEFFPIAKTWAEEQGYEVVT